ncbi:CP2 transcription factor-domain-containing protein [Fennellomyces sp. T-0311]|nr:CP2 transcription factor-domain-containing protein [Fennellomyces sp. T-0311]
MMIQPQQQDQQKLYHSRAVSLNYPLSANMDRPWRHATTPPMLPAMVYGNNRVGCMLNDGWASPPEYLSSSSGSSSSSSNGSACTATAATMTPSPVDMVLSHPAHNQTASEEVISSVDASPESLRITGILAAPTAISPKTDDALITYLNRGQLYAIDLKNARHPVDSSGTTLVTTTVSITFHEKSHRQVANNYWKFWLNQQRNPPDARAISIDDAHCCGVANIKYTAFDRITFDWDIRQGSRIHVRFHCLSTDFSRIKGVKGIPLRIHLEHRIPSASQAAFDSTTGESNPSWEYVEESFCKIKLFRDKGAERKNKDNSKQYMKHCQKMQENAKAEQQKNLMELMYDLQRPFSMFGAIPKSPPLKHLDDFNDFEEISRDFFAGTSTSSKRNRVMTAPSALFHGTQPPSAFCSPLSSFPMPPAFTTSSTWSPFPSPAVTTAHTGASYFYTMTESPTSIYPTTTSSAAFDGFHGGDHKEMMVPTQQQNCVYTEMPPPVTNSKKRSREATNSDGEPKKRISIRTGDNVEPQWIELQEFTAHELKVKLCMALSLHPDQVSHIVWRPKDKGTLTSSPRKKSSQEIFITLDDDFITQDLLTWQNPSASWEIKSDGTVRIVLEN